RHSLIKHSQRQQNSDNPCDPRTDSGECVEEPHRKQRAESVSHRSKRLSEAMATVEGIAQRFDEFGAEKHGSERKQHLRDLIDSGFRAAELFQMQRVLLPFSPS